MSWSVSWLQRVELTSLWCGRYGSPTHRLESQIQSTARVLELELQCIYLPGLMLISFGDSQTHTSDIKVRRALFPSSTYR